MKKVDVAIVGAGTAGLSARREVEKVTKNYVVIDDGILGTTCARVGCMPSKVLIHAANTYHHRYQFSQLGIRGAESLHVDQKKVMEHVRGLRDRFVRSVLSGMEQWKAEHFIAARAQFIDRNTLQVGDQKIFANKIIIATGSKPIVPQNWIPYRKYLFDTDAFFEKETLPQNLAVVGLGVIGLELGQALHRLGVNVTGVTRGRGLGGLTDPTLQEYAIQTFSKELPIFFDGAEVLGEDNGQIVLSIAGEEKKFESAFLTMGRKPALDKLGLENLSLEFDQKGIPVFDANTFQVGNTSIYIAGDVTGDRPILHEAADEGRIVGYNAVRAQNQCFRRREKLAITFSEPNIAIAGKSHKELVSEGKEFVIGKVSFEGFGRAIVMLQEVGLLHIYAEKTTGLILGAELFGPQAEHLAHLLAWSISLGLTVHKALSLPFYHPVLEEALRTALRDAAVQVEVDAPVLEILRCQDPPVGIHGK